MNEAASGDFKFKTTMAGGKTSAFAAYRSLCYGTASLGYVVKAELLALLVSGIPGAPGLWLRQKLYPCLFRKVGRKVVFGRNLTLRHAHKIELGDGTVIDDNCVLDAKGSDNQGISLGAGVYVGRNTIVYCKNGNIRFGDAVNVSSNCQVFSSNDLEIGAGTVVAAFTYILSGGQYDVDDRQTPFARQSGMLTRGPTRIGPNCWIGAGAVIVDGVTLGEHCVVAAGAVVSRDVAPNQLVAGVPARLLREI
jgi:acetyltransferase-like isoleucine patch superfamily enzyme